MRLVGVFFSKQECRSGRQNAGELIGLFTNSYLLKNSKNILLFRKYIGKEHITACQRKEHEVQKSVVLFWAASKYISRKITNQNFLMTELV